MIYLTSPRPRMMRIAGERDDIGYLRVPDGSGPVRAYAGIKMGLDNDCFAHPERFSEAKYMRTMTRHDPADVLFVNAPDSWADWPGTVRRFEEWSAKIRGVGLPACIVSQPGSTPENIPWELTDAVFLGGPNRHLIGPSGAAVVREAKRRGKWVHMGRVNSHRRIAYANHIGCDSTDGTWISFAPDLHIPLLLSALNRVNGQETLGYTEPEHRSSNAPIFFAPDSVTKQVPGDTQKRTLLAREEAKTIPTLFDVEGCAPVEPELP